MNTSDNKYQLQKVFYPFSIASPVFVVVTYQYSDTRIPNQRWYWSTGVFYFFQPLQVFQFTSLFFGNPEFRTSELNITLPAECASAPEEFMTRLTEMVRKHDHPVVIGASVSEPCTACMVSQIADISHVYVYVCMWMGVSNCWTGIWNGTVNAHNYS